MNQFVELVKRFGVPYLLYMVTAVIVQLVLPGAEPMLLTLITGVILIPLFGGFYWWDRHSITDAPKVKIAAWLYILPCITGILMCLALNHLITLSGLIHLSPAYQQLQNDVFGKNVLLTFITSVLMAPVMEELLFRGLLYARLRSVCPAGMAAVISAAAFGLAHGNLVQFVYAFLAGMILAFLYEKYHGLTAPVLAHFSANAISVFVTAFLGNGNMRFIYMFCVFVCECAGLIICCILVQKKVTQ